MNDRQRSILIWGVVAAVAAGLYPPWNYTTSLPHTQPSLKPAGYNFILDPPAPEDNSEFYGVSLDTRRLLVEWAVVALVVCGMTYTAKNSEQGHYQTVARELQDGSLQGDLWARALAKAGGEDDRTKARYIDLRVVQLAEEERIRREQQFAESQARRQQQVVDGWKRLFLSFFRKMSSRGKPSAPTAPVSRAYRLLATDDEAVPLQCIKAVLEPYGYDVVTFKSKVEALERLGEIRPDLVITDIYSPEMSGLEFIRLVKEFDPSIPAIIITGYETLESAREAVRLGVFDYLNKPFDPPYLRSVIEAALKTRRSDADVSATPRHIAASHLKDTFDIRETFSPAALRGGASHLHHCPSCGEATKSQDEVCQKCGQWLI